MKSNRLPEQHPDQRTEKRSTPAKRPAKRQARRGARGATRNASGAAGFGTLASPRDRARVQARNAAERGRVEEMLASAPTHLRALASPEPASVAYATPVPTSAPAVKLRHLEQGCPVCASQSVTSDEVFVAGTTTRLSECLNCDHRWTARLSRRVTETGASMNRGNRGARGAKRGTTPAGIAVA